MGIFGTIKKGLGKVGKFVGKVGKVAIPVLAATTGMGIPLAAALGAGSGLLSGGGVKGALTGAAGGVGGGLAGRALGTTGLLGKAKGLLMGGRGAPAGADMVGAGAPGAVQANGGGKPGLLSRIGQFITSDPERAAALGLAGANLISGASRAGQADQRLAQARASLMEPEREDLSALYADPGNPYAQPRRNRALEAARMSLAGGY